MPGVYTEPESRAAPTHDPACEQYGIVNDRNQTRRALLQVAVLLPERPEPDRGHRPCAGHGRSAAARRSRTVTASPTSGRASAATCRSRARASPRRRRDRRAAASSPATAARSEPAKDVGIRADRADGTVIRNVKVRHAAEHAIYVLESRRLPARSLQDVLRRRVRRADVRRGPRRDVELRGRRQRRLGPVPGRRRRHRPSTATSRVYPQFRYSQEIHHCDSHHNTSGYSGHRRQRRAPPRQQLLRQRARLHDRRLHGARATRASRRTRT